MSKIEYDDSKNPYLEGQDCGCLGGCVNSETSFEKGFKIAVKEANARIERQRKIIDILCSTLNYRLGEDFPLCPQDTKLLNSCDDNCGNCWLAYVEREAGK